MICGYTVQGVLSLFFCKQKTAYELRISDWSSDVCSSDLLKFPLWFMGDVNHGFRTIFPVPLALAASWDTDLVQRVHRAAAVEATAAGVDWTFSPMVDIGRDPRRGRVVEGAGEIGRGAWWEGGGQYV